MMMGAVGRGRGRANVLENGPPAPLRRPRERTSSALPAGAGAGAGEPAPPQPQQLRRPGAPAPAAAPPPGGQDAAAPVSAFRLAAGAGAAPGLNPHSTPFVPAAPPSTDGSLSTPEFSEWGSDVEVESEAPINTALLSEIPPPQDSYQSMIYNNLAEALWNMACTPASFDRQGSVLVENVSGWLPSSDIPLSVVLDFMLNQVAYVPSFRYVCAKLCHVMCSRCRVTQDGRSFRDLLLSRCQSLYQNAAALLTESVPFFCDVTVLFCELYLHVRLAGGEEPIAVLGSAVIGLCGQLLDDVTPERVTSVCRALKLTGAALERQVSPALDTLMERVRAAAFDGRLPRGERHALLELTTLRAAHWGGGESSGTGGLPSPPPAADSGRPLQGYLPADPSSGLSTEERRFLEQQLQATDDDDEDELDDAYDTFLEELDNHRR